MEEDETKRQEAMSSMDENDKEIAKSEADFEAGIQSSDEREKYNAFSQAITDFSQFKDNIITLIKENQMDEAKNLLSGSQATQLEDELKKSTDDLMNLKVNLAKQYADQNTASAENAATMMIVVTAAGIIIALILPELELKLIFFASISLAFILPE
jgi:CHASE3 domain sensor protein